MSNIITVVHEGIPETHMRGFAGGFATACGLDGDDPGCNQSTIKTKRGAKINCHQCAAIFFGCREYRQSNFDKKSAL